MTTTIPPPDLSYDANGVAGITAAHSEAAYYGIGMLHARHRQAQALQVWSVAQGKLSTSLLGALPQSPTYPLDELAHRIEAPRLGAEAWQAMRLPERSHLQAYVDGFRAEGKRVGRPWERFALGLMPLEQVTPAAVLSGVLFMAYQSQARGQANMEQLLIQLLQAGASPTALRELHHPYLGGWQPETAPDDAAYHATLGAHVGSSAAAGHSGGSNAWAWDARRSHSHAPMLFGDPHLPVGELPGSFFEVRVRLPHNQYWLGGTLPGFPAVVVGRNASLAWSNTHACGKALDSSLLQLDASAHVIGAAGHREPLQARAVAMGPRWAFWARRQITLWQSPWGALLHPTPAGHPPEPGAYLTQRWAAGQSGEQLAKSVAGYMGLVGCANVREAQTCMGDHQTFTFHMVYADRAGDIAYQQVGAVPERHARGHGLMKPWLPHDANTPQPPWNTAAEALPAAGGLDDNQPCNGTIVSANEAQLAPSGATLAPLAQPNYRRDRIAELLAAAPRHDRADGAHMQLDTVSRQGELLVPRFLQALGDTGTVAQALRVWDFNCVSDSIGAHAFFVAYQAALHGLAQELGHGAWHDALNTSEVGVWWAKALDALLSKEQTWHGPRGDRLRAALHAIKDTQLSPWGEVQTVQPAHALAGLVPFKALRRRLGLTSATQPLPGSLATVRQGNLVPNTTGKVAVAAAYRVACDLGTNVLHTSLPTGPNQPDRGRLLDEWHRGVMHPLRAPNDGEAATYR